MSSRWRDPESQESQQQSPPQYNPGYVPAQYTMDSSYGNGQQPQHQQQQFQYSSYGDHGQQPQPYSTVPARGQQVYQVSPEMQDVNLYSNPPPHHHQQQQQQYVAHQAPPPPGHHGPQQYTPMMPTAAFGGGGGYQLKDSTHVDQPGAAGGGGGPTTYSEPAGEDHDPATAPDGVLPPPVEAHKRRQLWLWALRYFLVVAVVFVALLVPILVTEKDGNVDLSDAAAVKSKRKSQLIYYVFSWLLVSWVSFVFFDLVGLALPYMFRFIARYVNPAHQKYWRFLRTMRLPICLTFGIVICFVSFTFLITFNHELAIKANKGPDDFGWDDVISDILEQVSLWAGFYMVEKMMILYISIHYHYRGNNTKILKSKDMMNALITLYDASLYLHPAHSGAFDDEDAVIRDAHGGREHTTRRRHATTYLSRLGVDSYGMASFFGNFVSSTDPRSHWFRPSSSYAAVERCLSSPRAAAALARRIWVPLASGGAEVLTAADVAEVLGPYRKDEAAAAFAVLDPDGAGDVRLDEMVMAVVEAGKMRHDVYRGMHAADHCINTFDWVCLTMLAFIMIFFIMLIYVPSIKQIQQQVSVLAVGLGFAAGRAAHHFLIGVVYVFFDHPFDVGDRVEVYNLSSTTATACVVKRVSLLYTVFRRVDTGSDMQIQNQQLVMKRVENITRSGANRQWLSMFVDFTTSFQDLAALRRELAAFVAAPENRRDYMPDVTCGLVGVHELNKLELRCSVAHRSNWANERLRAARSNKFYCALLAAVRKIQLSQPAGPGAMGRPVYTAHIGEEAAARMAATYAERRKGLRVGKPPAAEDEGDREGVDKGAAAATEAADPSADPSAVREDRERRDREKEEMAKAVEAERVALATLQRVPVVEKETLVAASSAIEINEFIGVSTTGTRKTGTRKTGRGC
ncbi:hypothetical protein RB598_001998 [Gaeumannomyces tritici]